MNTNETFTCPICGNSHRLSAKYCPTTGLLIEDERAERQNRASDFSTDVDPSVALTGRLSHSAVIKDRYKIIDRTAKGGMAAVYQALDIHLPGKIWAVKEMSESWITDPDERSQAIHAFQQEALILASLDHPNLPKVIDTFSQFDKQYLVMEFIQGQTLEKILEDRSRPFTEAEMMPWALQLCDVLYYLHTQPKPIIFRDLKPSNIMIDENGQVKLIDFGIVRFFKPGKAKDTMAFGTQGYCAIEALSGQTDARSDLYSLCVVMHEMLTLHDPSSTMFRLPPIRKINPDVSVECETVLHKGLEKDRDKRWSDLDKFSKALSQINISEESTIRVPDDMSVPVIKNHKIDRPEVQPMRRTSRPTERLAVAMSGLSSMQLIFITSILTVAIIVAFWFLSPILVDFHFIWNNLPVVSLAAPLVYAAVPRRWFASISHACFAIAGGTTIIFRLGLSQQYLFRLILGAILSAAFIEIWMRNLNRVRGEKGEKAWKRELAWFCGMSVIATSLLYEITFGRGFNLWLLLNALWIAALGWFIGDMLKELLKIRRLH